MRNRGLFEITMGTYDRVKVYELDGNYSIYKLSKLHDKKDTGL